MPRPKRRGPLRRDVDITAGERRWAMGKHIEDPDTRASVVYLTDAARLRAIYEAVNGEPVGAMICREKAADAHAGSVLYNGARIGWLTPDQAVAVRSGVPPDLDAPREAQ